MNNPVIERTLSGETLTSSLKELQKRWSTSLALKVALAYEGARRSDQALPIYRRLRAESTNSDGVTDLEVALGLARCLVATSNYADALGMLEKLSAESPAQSEVLSLAASCFRNLRRLDEAESAARASINADADNKLAKYELAYCLNERGKSDEALDVLRSNIYRSDIHGHSIDLWLAILEAQHRTRYAQDELAKLTQTHPNVVEFWYGVAVLANRAGEVSNARSAFHEALRIQPNNARILYDCGVMERLSGNFEKARELILRALALQPDNPAALRIIGSDTKYAYGDDSFRRLNFVAARYDRFTDADKANLHFALAKAYEDVGELETAFRHYEAGGNQRRKLFPHDERDSTKSLLALTTAVTANKMVSTDQKGFDSNIPVFILGMPRSGSSLLEQILSSHPAVFGAGELNYIMQVIENIQFGQLRLSLGEKEPAFPYEINASWNERGQRYVERIQSLSRRSTQRIVDKMPGNFNFVGLIHAILPQARIIHSRRHPVETCLSCYRILFAEGHRWSYDLRELGRYYRRYWAIMNHWRTEFPNVMYEVRYEDVVADTERQVRTLVDHLGLEWNKNCLNFHTTDRPVKTASVTQVRKPIYTTSTNRWRKYEVHLKPLLEEIGDIVEQYEAELTPHV